MVGCSDRTNLGGLGDARFKANEGYRAPRRVALAIYGRADRSLPGSTRASESSLAHANTPNPARPRLPRVGLGIGFGLYLSLVDSSIRHLARGSIIKTPPGSTRWR